MQTHTYGKDTHLTSTHPEKNKKRTPYPVSQNTLLFQYSATLTKPIQANAKEHYKKCGGSLSVKFKYPQYFQRPQK